LGLPPSLESCTRDTFPTGFTLSIEKIATVIEQLRGVFVHLHAALVCHGDLYAHNTLVDEQDNVLFGDFGAASMYHMLSESQQQLIKTIERRALAYFIDDLLEVCAQDDRQSDQYQDLKRESSQAFG
jgi:serine/threonine protein kinase